MADFARALSHLRRKEPILPFAPTGDNAAMFSIANQLQFLRSRKSAERTAAEPELCVLPAGEIESTRYGKHYIVRYRYPHDYYQGKVLLNRFSSHDLSTLMALMKQRAAPASRERVVFLDTETTGMQGGTGMCPFMVGVGYFEGDEFRVDQFFIRDFDEEPSMLASMCELLQRFDLLVTYNGAAFDVPLLETRLTLARLDSPFAALGHFDLLNTARRLWRNGHGSCRLVALEKSVMSFLRGPDVPGSMIPRVYFDYLNQRPSPALPGIFTHNAHDIVSLAGLTVLACDRVVLEPALFDDPLDVYSIARVVENSADWRRSLLLYEQTLGSDLPEGVRFKTLESLSVLYRRANEHARSLKICLELINGPLFSLLAYEGAAIYYERIAEDYEAARRIVESGLHRLEVVRAGNRAKTVLRKRWDRLQQKVIGFPSLAIS